MLLERLIAETGLKRSSLEAYAATASKRYYLFSIAKRDGGQRTIAHPARPIKALQRWANLRFLGRFPIHECATAYRKGVGIKDNAARHACSRYTTRLDIENFFPTFKREGIIDFLSGRMEKFSHYDLTDIQFFSTIFTRYDELTIGAPSSPILTNVMMYDLDIALSQWAAKRNLIYSRYADDIFISSMTPDNMIDVEQFVQTSLDNYRFAKLRLNKSKTRHLNRKYHRSVTGLTLTPEGKVSIGRRRKREIKSLIWKFKLDQAEGIDVDRLCGLVAFALDVEPVFIEHLAGKYGSEVVQRLLKRSIPIGQ